MIRLPNPDSERNIRRIDSKKRHKQGETHGFQVHFQRDNIGFTSFFSDLAWGGKEEARIKARKLRDEWLLTLPGIVSKLSKNQSGFTTTSTSKKARSNTGHFGISFTSYPLASGGSTSYFEANVRLASGKMVNKKFRIDDQDLSIVIQQAIEWREDMLTAPA